MSVIRQFLCQVSCPRLLQSRFNHGIVGKNVIGIPAPCLRASQRAISTEFDDPNATGKKIKMSKAMKAYLQRAHEQDEFMRVQTHEYEVGKRHLANMMGEDPDTFTQDDIDKAIEYLVPSGLYEPKARPMFQHPTKIFPKRKDAEFDFSGRPFHFLFYTGRPNFYEILFQTTEKVLTLNGYEDKMISTGVLNPEENQKVDLGGTHWFSKAELEQLVIEKLQDKDYDQFLICMNWLVNHPYSGRETDFIMKYRKKMKALTQTMEIDPLKYDDKGIAFMDATGTRKHCVATVTVRNQGTGKIEINGQDLSYFERVQDREQIMYPLHFTGKLHKVDMKALVTGEGTSAQSGAIRLALSLALRSFLSTEEVERMRLAGLLTRDVRRRERKKPGQEGARRKRTWQVETHFSIFYLLCGLVGATVKLFQRLFCRTKFK